MQLTPYIISSTILRTESLLLTGTGAISYNSYKQKLNITWLDVFINFK